MDNNKAVRIYIYQCKIVDYYNKNGRKYLPWRKTTNPWEILLSEILLRKTTAKQVEKVYRQLVEMNPTDLAVMDIKKLEALLRPLGIQNQRARLIKNAAQKAANNSRDAFEDESFLLSISGVGQYAINTVMCFSFGKARPALDRNMIRVMGRVFSIKSDKPRPHTDKELWKQAESLVSAEHPKEYNWGVLDLAAEICIAKKPRCNICPINDICDYWSNESSDINNIK